MVISLYLDARFQRQILTRPLRFISIKKETHPQIKFDVFERINSGAAQLTAQELRHGIYYGRLIREVDKIGSVDPLASHCETRPRSSDQILGARAAILGFSLRGAIV